MKMGVDKYGKILAHKHLRAGRPALQQFGIANHLLQRFTAGMRLMLFPNMRYDAYRVFTNKPPAAPTRPRGLSNRACFEAQLDMIAAEPQNRPGGNKNQELRTSRRYQRSGYYLAVSTCGSV